MYFDSYFGELKYLFKKLDKMDDINDGINKLLSKIVITKLGYNSKESFIKYIYDKYIGMLIVIFILMRLIRMDLL